MKIAIRHVWVVLCFLFVLFPLAGCDESRAEASTADTVVMATRLPRRATATATPNVPAPTVAPLSTAMAKRGARVDDLFTGFTSDETPGAAVMVIRKGKVVHSEGYGLANLKTGDPITPSHLFHIASIGKSFTALGIMMLAEEGLLAYDEPVGEYIPEFAWMGKGVTIRRLLYHTSGITNYNNDEEVSAMMEELSDTPGNAELLAALSIERELDYRPGNKYDYSNTGYDVLGLVIERLSGQSYADFMEERIFAPLGMTHTFVLPNPDERKGPLVALSYVLEDGEKPEPYPSDPWDNLSGSGAIYSSVEDMFFYDQALYTDELVSQATLMDEAFTSGTINNGHEIDYGFAWEVGEYNDDWYVSHSGYWLAFDSYFLRFPDAELSIIVLLNQDGGETDAETLAFEIADIYQ